MYVSYFHKFNQQLITEASQEFPPNVPTRVGNTLLYPIAGSLYYFVPIYAQYESGGTKLENLIITGLINAFDKTTFYGDTLDETYGRLIASLGINETSDTNQTDYLDLTVIAPTDVDFDLEIPAELDIILSYLTSNDSLPIRNLTLNMTIWTDFDLDVQLFNQDLTPVNYTTSLYGAALNYTISTWSGPDGLNPSEIRGFTLKINLANISSL